MQAAIAIAVREFLDTETTRLRDRLAASFPSTRITPEQLAAWDDELDAVRSAFSAIAERGNSWTLLFEYRPPLSSTRADVVVVTGNAVAVLEFKMAGREGFASQNRVQALTYASDIFWSHPLAQGRAVDAAVVATRAPSGPNDDDQYPFVADESPRSVRRLSRGGLLHHLNALADADAGSPPSPAEWLSVAYSPRPTIVDAAVGLVASTRDPTITVPLADDFELQRLTESLAQVVHKAAENRSHVVVFVAGVPGAGKTLVGLRIAHDEKVVALLREEGAVPLYLSGNFPLVQVLTEALARDRAVDPAVTLADSRMVARTLIRMVHDFVSQHSQLAGPVPATNLVVFDEAQRAWDAEQMARGPSDGVEPGASEPEALLASMARKQWAVVVALVGTGQEINRGEAGVDAWSAAIHKSRISDRGWDAIAPASVASLFSDEHVEVNDDFFLSTSRRAQGLPDMPDWVEALLSLRIDEAARTLRSSPFEVVVTRDLDAARGWLRSHERRFRPGLVASSRAGRLRPYGLELSNDLLGNIPWERWFLDVPPSLHSSYLLEVAASEFKCQGLELDLVGMCWGWDFTPNHTTQSWDVSELRSSIGEWRRSSSELRRRWTINAYRVLLTRARVGMIIWVPAGDDRDPSRPTAPMDRVYEVLVRSGARPLISS